MYTEILADKLFNEKILLGVNKIANMVGVTLGPKGRTIILKQKGSSKPIITKDGQLIARSIQLNDPFENLGAQIVKQAAESTVLSAGDGTTTSTILAQAIFNRAQSFLISGISAIDLKNGIESMAQLIVAYIKEASIPISRLEDIEAVATIASNGDKALGKLIALAVDKVGEDGSITVQESRTAETFLDLAEGFSFDSGVFASAFITDERRSAITLENPYILITDRYIGTIDDIIPVLELIARDARPLVIVGEQIEGQALAALIMHHLKGTLKICAIKAPRYGEERREVLNDLALITGGIFVSRESGLNLKQIRLEMFGRANIVEATKTNSTIVSKAGDQTKIKNKISQLKAQLSETKDLKACGLLQERIGRLASGIAIIKVGGATEAAMLEKKHRVEDALEAVRAALEEGIVPGGGTILFRASKDLKLNNTATQQHHGQMILLEAIKEPFRRIIQNTGASPDVFEEKMIGLGANMGVDATSNQIVDLIKEGIIDPSKVVRCALENAVSAACMLLMCNGAVVEV